MRMSEGQIVMAGSVPLQKLIDNRLLTFPHGESWHGIFTLLLHATPIERDFDWSDWEEERVPKRDLPVTQQFRIRYRVRLADGG